MKWITKKDRHGNVKHIPIKPKWKIKSKKEMGDYIALHYLEPRISKEFGIKNGEIWVREDWWADPEKRKRLKVHELVELNLMNKGVPYYKAHKIANEFEHNAIKHLRGRK